MKVRVWAAQLSRFLPSGAKTNFYGVPVIGAEPPSEHIVVPGNFSSGI